MVVCPQGGSDNWSVTAEFLVLGVHCEPDESGAQNSNCPIVLPPTWNIPMSAEGVPPGALEQSSYGRYNQELGLPSCLMAILLTSSTEWESYVPYGLRVAKFCGTLHVAQSGYSINLMILACVCQGVVNVHTRVYSPLYFFFPTEFLIEPGDH